MQLCWIKATCFSLTWSRSAWREQLWGMKQLRPPSSAPHSTVFAKQHLPALCSWVQRPQLFTEGHIIALACSLCNFNRQLSYFTFSLHTYPPYFGYRTHFNPQSPWMSTELKIQMQMHLPCLQHAKSHNFLSLALSY